MTNKTISRSLRKRCLSLFVISASVTIAASAIGLSQANLAQAASDDVAASVAAVGVSSSASTSKLSNNPTDKFATNSSTDVSALAEGTTRAPYKVKVIGPAESATLTPGVSVEEDGSVCVVKDGGWKTGKASAYSLDTNTGYDATASGIKLTENSMTVAVPTYRKDLIGKTCEIYYHGMTVRAKVTDTGGFASRGRALDLAGGVWRAFGASSSDNWGVRTVSYRFVD